MRALLDWILNFNSFSALAGMLYFIIFMRSRRDLAGIIFLVLTVSFIADNLNYFFVRFIYPNSFIIGNSWYIIDYLINAIIFSVILQKWRKVSFILLSAYLIGTVVSFSFFYSFTESNTFIRIFSNASWIALSLVLYVELLNRPSQKLGRLPLFWFATAYFVNSSLILLQSVFDNYLIFDLKISGESYIWINIIKLIANIGKNFTLFYVLALIDKGFPSTLKLQSSE